MRILKLLAIGWVVVLSLVIAAYGNEWNKKTIMKLSEPMQIEGVLLQPGTYVFKLFDSSSDRHVVRIMNEDETKVVATVIGMPHYELEPPNKTQLDFYETPSITPPAVKTWHYPGEMLGLKFTQPPPTQVAVAPPPAPAPPPVAEAPVPAPPAPEVEPAPAAPPEVAQAEPAPAPEAPAPAPIETLPKTASNLPLAALLGLSFVSLSFFLRRLHNEN